MPHDTYCVEGKGHSTCVPEFPDVDRPKSDLKIPSDDDRDIAAGRPRKRKHDNEDLPRDQWNRNMDRYSLSTENTFKSLSGLQHHLSTTFWNTEHGPDLDINFRDSQPKPLLPGEFVPMTYKKDSPDDDNPERSPKEGCGTPYPKLQEPKPKTPCGPNEICTPYSTFYNGQWNYGAVPLARDDGDSRGGNEKNEKSDKNEGNGNGNKVGSDNKVNITFEKDSVKIGGCSLARDKK